MALLEELKGSDKTPAEKKEAMQSVFEKCSAMTQMQLAELIPYFRVQEARKPESGEQQGKLTISFNPLADVQGVLGMPVVALRSLVLTVLQAHGLLIIQGTPPRPQVERAVQANLTKQQTKRS